MAMLASGSGLFRWDFSTQDVLSRSVVPGTIEGRVTALSFGTRSTREQSETMGHFLGDRFGGRFGFQSVALINTSHMPFFIKPFVSSVIKRAYAGAVDDALEEQKLKGNHSITAERVRSQIYFIDDQDGELWRRFGANPDSDDFYFGILDANGRLIYMAKNPSDYEEVERIFERELTKLETKVSRK